ncbi:hypothetical protein ACWEPM_23930 [Streptomyces sp. NPDC004244]
MEAFTVLGGVPSVHIRYDDLKPAVKLVLFGRSRLESARWASFMSWYQFSAFYCAPGEDGAHEKGGVEHEGGRFRRKLPVPPPQVEFGGAERASDGEGRSFVGWHRHVTLVTAAHLFVTEQRDSPKAPARA